MADETHCVPPLRPWKAELERENCHASTHLPPGPRPPCHGSLRLQHWVEALKQQWSGDHELLVFDGDHKRDRDRKVRAYVQTEADEWKPETYQKESATEVLNAWNPSEPRDAWEQASVDEAGTWEDEDDPFEGSFADEDEEEAFHLAETQLNEAPASERNARRTVAQARAIMHDVKNSRGGYYRQGASKKRSEAGESKGKGQGKDRDSRRQAYGQLSNLSTSQTGTGLHKPMSSSVRPRLKCGSRDHEPSKCPKNQEHRSYMAHAMNFTAWCLDSDEMQNKTAEAFGCESRARGNVLLDCGETGTVGSVESIIDHSQEACEADPDWVSVDTNDWPVYKFGDAKRKQALSKVRVKEQPGGHVAHLHLHAQETLLSAKSLSTRRAANNIETGQAVFRNLEPETVVQLERSPTGHLWMDLFEQMPVVSDNPLLLPGSHSLEQRLVGCRKIRKSKCGLTVPIPIAHFLSDRRMRLTILTRRQGDDRKFSLGNPYHRSHSSISRHLSLRRLKMASARIIPMARDEEMEQLEQLGWEPVANVTYTLLEKKSIRHELQEKTTKSEMNDNSNVCADLSQKNKTELRDVCKMLSIPLSGQETTPQLKKFATHVEQSLGTSQKVTSSPEEEMTYFAK